MSRTNVLTLVLETDVLPLVSLTPLSSLWLSKVHVLLHNLQVPNRCWRPRRSSPESLYSSSQIPRVVCGTAILESEELVLPQPLINDTFPVVFGV